MLSLFPFDPWLTIVGLIFRRIEINALPTALVMLFLRSEVICKRKEETKYRKYDVPDRGSPPITRKSQDIF